MCLLADYRDDEIDVGDEVRINLDSRAVLTGVIIKKPGWFNKHWVIQSDEGNFVHVLSYSAISVLKKAERIQTGE